MYARRAPTELVKHLADHRHIAHRATLADAGFGADVLRLAILQKAVVPIKRHWIALTSAAPELQAAAHASARLTCVSFARHRTWWIPEGVDSAIHLYAGAHGRAAAGDIRVHWSRPVAPPPARSLLDSVENALEHIALCQPPEAALLLWESAMRSEGLSAEALRRVNWTSRSARRYAEQVRGLSDSGLETIFASRLAHLGVRIIQQFIIGGRPVDALLGERLVVQIDGYEFHSSSAGRTKDVAFDAELRLRGYTVLRFTYAQIVHDWPAVERTIARALASGLHLAR